MSNLDPLVKFENVQKSYDGEILVVKDFNLDVAKGEFVTMLGPSGSGKTTCLMMLAGFEPTTNGTIYLKDKPINNVPPHKRGIGMVFQNYALFPHMTVAENLAFPLEVRKMGKSEREAKVNRALDMVQLGEFGSRRPMQLSGGQQQRVSIARAIAGTPKLILADEPTGALDSTTSLEIMKILNDLNQTGITIVLVTHEDDIAKYGSRIIKMKDGKIIEDNKNVAN